MSSALEKLENGEIPLDFNWQRDPHPNSPVTRYLKAEPDSQQAGRVKIVAEDLRDGLHGVAEYPQLDHMISYVDALAGLGVDIMTVGIFPGEGNKVDRTIKGLLGKMRDEHPEVTPIVLSQASEAALNWLGDCKQINDKLNAIVFLGTAPSRLLVEEWSQKFILDKLAWAVNYATNKLGVDVVGATEHTTQTPPDFLKKIIDVQVQNGAKCFCIADTIGIARPPGAYRLVSYVKGVLNEIGANDVLVDWHGHRDLGNDVGNAMAAIAAGADRVHTVARGIGERSGNTQMEAVMLNLNMIMAEEGLNVPWDLSRLSDVVEAYGIMVKVPAPEHGPMSKRSRKTSLGIHTAAILKAMDLAREAAQLGKNELSQKLGEMAQTIYSAVDPNLIGRKHEISVGPWSGSSTVRLAVLTMGGDPKKLAESEIQRVLDTAKQLGRELTVNELQGLLENHG
jgi:2-isopropylmalate synthase